MKRVGTAIVILFLVRSAGFAQPARSAQPRGTTVDLPVDHSAAQTFLAHIRAIAATAEREQHGMVSGSDGWLFFVKELRSLSVGPFWSEHAAKTSIASNPEYADPLAAILDFNDQLKKADIELLLVPVPAKAAVYPRKISNTPITREAKTDRLIRFDLHHQRFYEVLRKHGVDVLDLLPLLAKHRNDKSGHTYCRTDTHWSGRGVVLSARRIHEHVRRRKWLQDYPRQSYARETRDVTITGDLARMADEVSPRTETLPLVFVGRMTKSGPAPLETDRESPVLVMGDSHTLVFHDPTLHAKGAGLADHLAFHFGFQVDLVGIRGSGATAARIALLRRGDNLKGKKLVIWCLSAREFTESVTGWRKVPVIRDGR